MALEMITPEEYIIRECADKNLKQADIARTYAVLIKLPDCKELDWKSVNKAIVARWSTSGLISVKKRAWTIVNGVKL